LHVKKNLTAEQRQDLESVQRRQEKIIKQLRDINDELRERWNETMNGVPKSEWHAPENREKWRRMYAELHDSDAYKQHQAEYDRVKRDLRQFVTIDQNGQDGPDVPHGFVWLFRRK
jgi:hypothetical protein